MTREEIQERKAELTKLVEEAKTSEELTQLREDIEKINAEVPEEPQEEKVEEVKEEVKEEKAEEITEAEERSLVRPSVTQPQDLRKVEIRMENKEIETRNSKEYVNAYAEYIKTGKDEEVRSLLTENVSGNIAVPDMVYDIVKTSWDKEQIMSLVHKVSVKGNLKVNFEISGTDAVVHTEGGDAVTEETLTHGIVTITPVSIKKWISISDEVMDMRGSDFLNYIYAELTQKITKKAADVLVAKIAALPQSATSTSPAAAKIAVAPSTTTVATAIANLSDEADKPVIIMNKLTYAEFKAVQYSNGYGVDVFEGCDVKFNNTLPAYSTAGEGAVYMIVGDLDNGSLANFPNGIGNIEFKFDDVTRKKEDLIEVLGREYVGIEVVNSKAFTLVAKPTASV